VTIGYQLSGTVPGCEICSHADIAVAADGTEGRATRNPDVDLATPVLLVYTSGTTGQPKGAVLTQEAVLFNALNSVHMHDLDTSDHILTALPMFHVGGLNIQTTPALYVGATVTLQRRFEPATVLSAIRDLRPTRLVLVPATIMALAEHPDFKRTDFSSIRSVTTGSTIVHKSVIDIFHDRNVPVIQNYGLTETGPVALYLRIDDAFSRVGSTGRGALHTRFRIVDDEDRDVPAGQSGELLLQGSNVLLEYWRDPAATREALQEGWFRTGDIGYCDTDGYVYINDRKKDVVISGGENIYPAELEHILDQMQGLIEAAVVGMPDNRWGEVPVAVIVPDSGCDIDKAKVLSCFDGVLAQFKHPKAVFRIDVLPRNVMGKVLKHELRQMLADEMLTPTDPSSGGKQGKLAQVL
jgi:fatty-acyl-CoA synthase